MISWFVLVSSFFDKEFQELAAVNLGIGQFLKSLGKIKTLIKQQTREENMKTF